MFHAIILTLLSCLLALEVFGQSNPKQIIEDFNADGYQDTLTSRYEGGSGFGGRFITVINGKTKTHFELNTYGCFCQITRTVLLPPSLEKPENQPFLEIIKEHLLPEKRNNSEGSLEWLIKGRFSNKTLTSHIYFDLVIDPNTTWQQSFEYPYNYYLEIQGDTLHQFYNVSEDVPDWYDHKQGKGFLIYYAHNHYRNRSWDSLTFADSNSTYKAFRTSHGVLIRKGVLYKWVFMSDNKLTGAPAKLRWQSIGKVKLFDHYALIEQILRPKQPPNRFIVNIETGRLARLKFQIDDWRMIDLFNTLDNFCMSSVSPDVPQKTQK